MTRQPRGRKSAPSKRKALPDLIRLKWTPSAGPLWGLGKLLLCGDEIYFSPKIMSTRRSKRLPKGFYSLFEGAGGDSQLVEPL